MIELVIRSLFGVLVILVLAVAILAVLGGLFGVLRSGQITRERRKRGLEE